MLMRSISSFYEDAYLQFRDGLLDRDLWESRARTITVDLSRPGIGAWWKSNRHLYAKGFQQTVAELLAAEQAAAADQ